MEPELRLQDYVFSNPQNETDEELKQISTEFKPKRVVSIYSQGDDDGFWKQTERQPVNIVFKDISLSITKKRFRIFGTNKIDILKGINGTAQSGELLAILGSSGSGKTSLLNVIAHRIYQGQIGGLVSLEINGELKPIRRSAEITSVSGYVMQDDYLFPNLTVKETLNYYAMLRLPHETQEERDKQVNSVIQELRLTHVINTRIGGVLVRGVSGGERRRVSIGVQLLTNPSVLFLDEPTSGLDSTTARYIVNTLVKLARRGRTIICTIHQPRSDIFRLFDQVMLLSRGEIAYFGKADQLVHYFGAMGHVCPPHSNPADFALDIVSHTSNSDDNLSKEEIRRLIDKAMDISRKKVGNYVQDRKHFDYVKEGSKVTASKTTLWSQFNVLTQRSLKNLFRSKDQIIARCFNLTGMAIMFLALLFRLGYDQSSVQNRIGLVYQIMSGGVFVGLLNSVALFPMERTTFLRDNKDGSFSPFSFWLSYTLIEIIFDLVSVFVMSFIVYFGNNLQLEVEKYFIFVYVMYLLQTWGESIGCIWCCIFKDANIANRWGTLTLSFWLVTAGFFRAVDGMPIIIKITNYVSVIRYAGVILLGQEFSGLDFTCNSWERLLDGTCPTQNGEQVMDQLSLGLEHRDRDLIIFTALCIFTRLMLLAFVKLTLQRPRRFENKESVATSLVGLPDLDGDDPPTDITERDEDDETINEMKAAEIENAADQSPSQGREKIGKLDSVPPLTLTFSNVKYSVNITKFGGLKKVGEKQILKGMSGYARPGELLAILGTSGSGKSSLLNILAGRADDGNFSGDVFINDHRVKPNGKGISMILESTGYVTQDDVLLAHLTVRETLTFAAMLKLPSVLSKQEKLAQVDSVIAELGLNHCANTQIGGEFIRGVSGGERRRVSIGIQLLTNPSLLFLDEPTSGLDSTTANNIVSSLVNLTKRGRTIICTIHQPRSAIFYMFDQVMLLSKGDIAYFGPANRILSFFKEQNYEIPPYTNPTDFAMDLISVDTKNEKTEAITRERLDKIVQFYKENADKYVKPLDPPKSTQMRDYKIERASFWLSFSLLFRRAFSNNIRNTSLLMTKLTTCSLLAILHGVQAYHLGRDQVGSYDRLGCLSVMLGVLPFTSILACIVGWQTERLIFARERREGMYSPLPFYIAKACSEYPFEIIFGTIFWTIAYWMADLNNAADRFFISLGVQMLVLYGSQWYGYVFAAFFPQFAAANMAANVTFTLFVLVSGWAINYDNITVAFRWVKEISYLKYGYEALIINEYKGSTFYCTQEQLDEYGGFCPITRGEQVIQRLAMEDASFGKSFGFLIGFLALLNVLFYLTIRFKNQVPKL
eukprot:TRINITY_DN2833_c0_g1_i4.p1 TRINITY_DN2833_c0_g1~~TRINITY_DN2833_c0_g1_i4.p1  ORF type:complete len:1333 (-),score=277.19 TRINITY_DN2833_c0_g1_i4:35-4033(-)